MKRNYPIIVWPLSIMLFFLLGVILMGSTCNTTPSCSASLNAGVSLVPCNECRDINNCPFNEVFICSEDSVFLCWNANNASSVKIEEYDDDGNLLRSLGEDFPLSGETMVRPTEDRSYRFTRVGGVCDRNRSLAGINVNIIDEGKDSIRLNPYGIQGLFTDIIVNQNGFPQIEFRVNYAQFSSSISVIGVITLCDPNCWGPAFWPNQGELLGCPNGKQCFAIWTLNKWNNTVQGAADNIEFISQYGAVFRPGFPIPGIYQFVSFYPYRLNANPNPMEESPISGNFRLYVTCR